MNEELLNEFSNILKEKNIDLNSVLSSINSTGISDSASNNNENSNNDNNNNENESEKDNNNNTGNNNANNNPDGSNSSTDYSNLNNFLDLETIVKIKTIFDKYNNFDSKNIRLLMDLKPFMRESKRNKIDQYAQMLKMIEVFKTLNLFGGD